MILARSRTFRPLFLALLLAGLAAYSVSDAKAACALPVADLCTNDAYYPDDAMQHAAGHCVGTANRQQYCTANNSSQFDTATCPDGNDTAAVRASLQALCAALAARNSCNIVAGNAPNTSRMYATLANVIGYTAPQANAACVTTQRASLIWSVAPEGENPRYRVFDARPQP